MYHSLARKVVHAVESNVCASPRILKAVALLQGVAPPANATRKRGKGTTTGKGKKSATAGGKHKAKKAAPSGKKGKSKRGKASTKKDGAHARQHRDQHRDRSRSRSRSRMCVPGHGLEA